MKTGIIIVASAICTLLGGLGCGARAGGLTGDTPKKYSTTTLMRADGSTSAVRVVDNGPERSQSLLFIVAGSDCKRAESQTWMPQVLRTTKSRWVAIVDKDAASADGSCSAAYVKHSTEEARWIDNLDALSYLTGALKLKNPGSVQLVAISSGGLTACELARLVPQISAIALLSTGGGLSLKEEISVPTMGSEFINRLSLVEQRPQADRNWLGDSNPEIWWWSALSKRCAPLLSNFGGRTLIIHGVRDSSTPIQSAELLYSDLKQRHQKVQFIQMDSGHDLGQGDKLPALNGVAKAISWLNSGT